MKIDKKILEIKKNIGTLEHNQTIKEKNKNDPESLRLLHRIKMEEEKMKDELEEKRERRKEDAAKRDREKKSKIIKTRLSVRWRVLLQIAFDNLKGSWTAISLLHKIVKDEIKGGSI